MNVRSREHMSALPEGRSPVVSPGHEIQGCGTIQQQHGQIRSETVPGYNNYMVNSDDKNNQGGYNCEGMTGKETADEQENGKQDLQRANIE